MAYVAERGLPLEHGDVDFFRKVLASPVGLPTARGRYDVRQLHAYLPEGGGINLNTGVSEQSILQVMSTDDEALIEGARRAAEEAVAGLTDRARLVLVFSCGSRVPLLGDRGRDEVAAISSALNGVPVCGFTPTANLREPLAPAEFTTRAWPCWRSDHEPSRTAQRDRCPHRRPHDRDRVAA